MNEDDIIYNILAQCSGLKKDDATNVLSKTQQMLELTKSPIDMKTLREVWFPDLIEAQENDIMEYFYSEGYEHMCVGFNSQIYIFWRTSIWYSRLLPNKCLYYKLVHDPPNCLRKLTKENLLKDFETTFFQRRITKFLQKNKVCKKDNETGRFELLNVLDNIKLSDI